MEPSMAGAKISEGNWELENRTTLEQIGKSQYLSQLIWFIPIKKRK